MSTAEKSVYMIVVAGISVALIAFVIKLLTMSKTAYRVAGILLLILMIFWLADKNGESVILGGLTYAENAFGNWAKRG